MVFNCNDSFEQYMYLFRRTYIVHVHVTISYCILSGNQCLNCSLPDSTGCCTLQALCAFGKQTLTDWRAPLIMALKGSGVWPCSRGQTMLPLDMMKEVFLSRFVNCCTFKIIYYIFFQYLLLTAVNSHFVEIYVD